MTHPLLSNLATGAMVACAVTVTALMVRREVFPPRTAAAQPDLRPRRVSNWPELLSGGHRIGRADAPVQIVEFSDFQCPFCARTQPVINAVQRRRPDRVAVLYRHFPLDAIHPHARPAAVASECAAAQGRFQRMADLLFARQDSLGTTPWTRFAADAGVRDTAEFARCMARPAATAAVDRDARAGRATRVEVTPTLVINGTLYPGAITEGQLETLVTRVSPR